jgi:hypothetical protein
MIETAATFERIVPILPGVREVGYQRLKSRLPIPLFQAVRALAHIPAVYCLFLTSPLIEF